MALLTAEQLARLRDIIRDASTSVAISTTGMEVPDEDLQRLVTEGYVDPDDLHNVVLDSYEFGRLMAQLPDAHTMTYQRFINHLARNPVELSDQERRAFEFLQGRAGQFCVGLGTRYEGEMTLSAADMDQELAEAFRYTIQDEAGQSTARRETIGRLTTKLRQMSDDWARDWGRIASTESHIAHQMGFIENLAERHGEGELMAKIPEPTACEDCRRLYLEDGKPRVEPIEWWQRQGVANYGRKRADWKPVMGAMHPWCFPGGQSVITSRGDVPIEDVKIGDYAWTAQNRWRRIIQTHKRFYNGPLVVLEWDGKRISSTPAHQLGNGSGQWQLADTISDGGDLFEISRSNPEDCPSPSFQEGLLAKILLLLSPAGVPVAAVDFDGDLALPITQIDAVPSDDLIELENNAGSREQKLGHDFVGGLRPTDLPTASTPDMFVSLLGATNSFVSRSGQRFTLIGGEALHADMLRFAHCAKLDPHLSEALLDGFAAHPKLAGYRQYGQLILDVHSANSTIIEGQSARPKSLSVIGRKSGQPELFAFLGGAKIDSSLFESFSDGGRRKFSSMGDISDGSHLSDVEASHLSGIHDKGQYVKRTATVNRTDYLGYVYNLSVEDDESYHVEGIPSKNCQCQAVRVPRGWGFDENWDLVPEEMIEKSAAARPGEVREWKAGWHQKQADGSWKPVSSAMAYASRTLHRGLAPKWDEVQDLIQGVKEGDPEATRTAAAIMALMPGMKGFQGLVVAVPGAGVGKAPLTGLARELTLQGVGQAYGGMRRTEAVQSQRQRRRKGKRGLTAKQHAATMAADLSKVHPDTPILLVDDVFTSGATLEGAALALRAAGHKGPIAAAVAGRYEQIPTVEDSPFVPRVVQPGKEPTPVGKVVRRKKWEERVSSWQATLAGLIETRPGLMAAAGAEAFSRTASGPAALVAAATELVRSEDMAKARKLHYKTTFRGLPISIENRRGSKRYWYDPHTKTTGETLMRWPYGYIRMTEGTDGDHVDVFMGPHEDAKSAYVVHQMKAPHFKDPDEDKVMLGFLTAAAAKRAYLQHFDSPKFYGSMTVIPIQQFVDHALGGDYRAGKEIRKAGGAEPARKLPAQRQFILEPAPGSKKGARRRRKPGGGYEYQYPEFEVPSRPETHRGQRAYFARQMEINRKMAADPIAVVSTLYLNVSGGGEKARFVPVEGISGLAGRNLGVQITAHEVPKGKKAIGRFAQHARREGLKLMVDSGEFPRFAAERAIPGQQDKIRELRAAGDAEKTAAAERKLQRLQAKSMPLDFNQVFNAYERLADQFPAGTLTVVAPDRIGDAAKTAELRAEYKERVQALMDRGVHFIVPFQARDIEGLGHDYTLAAEAFGEGNFTIGLPMAKKPMPMDVMIPFVTKLYRAGRFPKLHFLGGSQPAQMAERTVQLVAAAYWSSRGLPEARVLELTRTPKESLRSISKVLSAKDVLTQEAEAELEPRMLAWAGAGAESPDFFDAHPEEFDLELDQKEGAFRQWAADLVQFDSSVVNAAVMNWNQHALAGEQEQVADYLEETPKAERHPGTLDRYLQAKVYQMERHIPPESSSLELVKAFRGTAGYVGISRPVDTMGNVGKPARTPGANTFAAQAPTDHPYGPDARKKKKKKKRKKRDRTKEKEAYSVSPVRYTDGYVRDKPKVDLEMEPDTERNREWLDDQQEKRAERRDLGGYTIHPQDTRP